MPPHFFIALWSYTATTGHPTFFNWTINWKKSMLEPSRILDFLGLHFNLEQAIVYHPGSFLDSFTSVLSHRQHPRSCLHARYPPSPVGSRTLPPLSINGCLHLRFLQFWIKRHWSQLKQSWDTQIQLDAEFLTQQMRSPSASPRTQLVFLHRCISNRMGSQLAESSSLRTVVTPRVLSAHQLAGARGHQIGYTLVGTAGAQSDCSGVLRQKYSSSLHSQTVRDPSHIFVQQNCGTISSSGPVCDSSHSNPSSRSQECDSRCTVSNQQPQSYRMEDSSGNLTQSVLCLREAPSGHVHHGAEQGDSSLCFTLPG